MKVLSIDIGISNLGYVYGEYLFDPKVNKLNLNPLKNNLIKILSCDRVDITNVKHSRVPFCECKLHHDYCIPDYLDHFIQEQQEMFENADKIIIERQPPVGITNVQDLLFTKFRSKVLLISPNTIHKYFNMSKEYSTRKTESESIASYYLKNMKRYLNNVRKHDISDALLMLVYHYSTEMNLVKVVDNPVNDFEKFRFSN
jgi:hypothetical protein